MAIRRTTSEPRSEDFQVVLLAGGSGARMAPLVSEGGTPKSMLPLCNRPMLFHQLYQLEVGGFDSVLIAATASSAPRITTYVHEIYPQDPLIAALRIQSDRPPLQISVESLPDGRGTADALRSLRHLVAAKYVLVLSSDLVADASLRELADAHRLSRAAATALVHPEPDTPASTNSAAAAQDDGDVAHDFIGLVTEEARRTGSFTNRRLVYFEAEADVEDALELPYRLLRRHAAMTVRTDLLDAHAYVFSSWVLDLLAEKPSFSSVKYQLVPFLVANQYKIGRTAQKLNEARRGADGSRTPGDRLSETSQDGGDDPAARPWVPEIPPPPPYAKMELRRGLGERSLTPCYAFVSQKNLYMRRVNTVKSYLQANRDIAAGMVSFVPKASFEYAAVWSAVGGATSGVLTMGSGSFGSIRSGQLAQQGERCNVSSDSVIGVGVQLGSKTSVKKTVVGDHCTLGSGVKLLNCILMDHVTIADNCNLQGTVVGSNAHIHTKSVLKECQVAESVTVPEGSESKGETFSVEIEGDELFY